MRTSNLRAIALPLCVLLSFLSPFIAQSPAQTVATWTGDAGNGDYYDAGNWDIGVIPINDATNTYAVVIPGGTTVSLSTDGSFEIDDFSLANSSTLNVGSGSTLTVLDEAEVAGQINTSSGHFVAVTPNAAQITGDKARFSVTNAGTIALAAQSYSSTGLMGTSGSSGNSRYWTYDLFTASGAESLLDLSSLQSIDAGLNDGTYDRNTQRIRAWDGGRIDLSAVQTITAPYQEWDDQLQLSVTAGSSIDLSSLHTIQSARSGTTRFYVSNATQPLPSLIGANRVVFYLNQEAGPGQVTAPELLNLSSSQVYFQQGSTFSAPKLTTWNTGRIDFAQDTSLTFGELTQMTNMDLNMVDGASLVAESLTRFDGTQSNVTLTPFRTFTTGGLLNVDNARFLVQDGAEWGVSTGDFAATSYSSTGLMGTAGGSGNPRSWTYDLFTASGAGSLLDLSSLQSLNAGFNDGDGADRNTQRIRVWDGGRIDLSGVQTITAPYQQWDDQLQFSVTAGSSIDLSSLHTIQSAGYGTTRLYVSNATQALPSLIGADQALFYLNQEAGPGQVTAPELLNLSSSQVYFQQGSTFSAPKLTTWNTGRIDFAQDTSLTFSELTQMTNMDLNMVDGASLVAESLTRFDGTQSNVTLTPFRTFTTGGLLNVDNARFFVEDGAEWGVSTGDFAATSYSSTGLMGTAGGSGDPRSWTYDLFYCVGGGEPSRSIEPAKPQRGIQRWRRRR